MKTSEIKFINVEYNKDGIVILDPGGADSTSPLIDEDGQMEETFNFYHHFSGRDWDYRKEIVRGENGEH